MIKPARVEPRASRRGATGPDRSRPTHPRPSAGTRWWRSLTGRPSVLDRAPERQRSAGELVYGVRHVLGHVGPPVLAIWPPCLLDRSLRDRPTHRGCPCVAVSPTVADRPHPVMVQRPISSSRWPRRFRLGPPRPRSVRSGHGPLRSGVRVRNHRRLPPQRHRPIRAVRPRQPHSRVERSS